MGATPAAPEQNELIRSASLSVSFADGSANATNESAPIIADNIEFDTDSGAIRLLPNAGLAYPDSGGINPEAGTVALWVRPEWDEDQPVGGMSLINLSPGTWENRFDLQIGPTYVRFMLTTSDGVEHPVGAGARFAAGEWHHIAATWGEGVLSLYVDGSLSTQASFSGAAAIPGGTPLYVGSARGGPRPGILSLRSLNIFQHELAPEDIAVLTEETAPIE